MIAVTRRDAMIAAAAAGALLPFAAALRQGAPGLFVYDARLDPAGSALATARRAGMEIVPVDGGTGWLSHAMTTRLAGAASVTGLTLPAVAFVVEQLALRRGVTMLRHAPYSWTVGLRSKPGRRARA